MSPCGLVVLVSKDISTVIDQAIFEGTLGLPNISIIFSNPSVTVFTNGPEGFSARASTPKES